MYDRMGVGVGDRIEDGKEELYALSDCRMVSRTWESRSTPSTYSSARNQVPSAVRPPSRKRAMPGCSRVARILTSSRNAPDVVFGQRRPVEELESDSAPELFAFLLGEEDPPHPASADLAQDPVSAYSRRRRRRRRDAERIEAQPRRGVEEPRSLRRGVEQLSDLARQRRITPLQMGQPSRALLPGELARALEELRQARIGPHAAVLKFLDFALPRSLP